MILSNLMLQPKVRGGVFKHYPDFLIPNKLVCLKMERARMVEKLLSPSLKKKKNPFIFLFQSLRVFKGHDLKPF